MALLLAMPMAIASNDLVQMDLKKSSSDSVDVTLFTSNPYNDNVLVRKKSDNKYVILIPKVQSSGFSRSSLNGVKDLVSDVDVKTVNDTTGGYTKVTLITTKPLDIKTRTQKTSPITSEQQEYNTLIAQANAVKNNIAKPVEKKVQPPKTEVTVNKAPAKVVETSKAQPKEEVKKVEPKKTTPQIKLTEVSPEDIQKQKRKQYLQGLIEEAKQERDVLVVPQEPPKVTEEPVNDLENIVPIQKVSLTSKIKNKIKGLIPTRFPKWAILPLVLLLAMARSNKGRREDFVEQQDLSSLPQSEHKYQSITDNKELSWQEKYQLYIDKSAVPVSRGDNKGNYTFIKKPAIEIEEKRAELEKMVEDLSYIAKEEDVVPEIVEVANEDEMIHKAIKFKAFDNHRASLSMTKRDKSRFKKYEVEIPLREQKTIDLGDSPLHSNPRNLKDANLKITDVDQSRIKYEPKDYIMSSLDEYFSIIDKEESAKTAAVQKPAVSNPIAKSNKNSLIVKSSFDIDNDKGFYLVNQNGQNALVGKVKDEVFVLKKFDSNVSNPIQVRHDNDNVYMVKAGKFKSLVEVNEDKMGVLIEL